MLGFVAGGRYSPRHEAQVRRPDRHRRWAWAPSRTRSMMVGRVCGLAVGAGRWQLAQHCTRDVALGVRSPSTASGDSTLGQEGAVGIVKARSHVAGKAEPSPPGICAGGARGSPPARTSQVRWPAVWKRLPGALVRASCGLAFGISRAPRAAGAQGLALLQVSAIEGRMNSSR